MINVSEDKPMKFNITFSIPQKSIFGFKVLSSFHSSISCYILLFIGRILNPFFGSNEIQTIAGSLFNIFLQGSIVILIINAIDKRKQIKKINFLLLNFILFLILPFSIYLIFKYTLFLLSFWIWNLFWFICNTKGFDKLSCL